MAWEKGDQFKDWVLIKKVKNNRPTVIEVGGEQYRLQHPDHIRGKQQINKKRG